MSLHEHGTGEQPTDAEPERGTAHSGHGEGSGHSRWMMIACCVPMLAIAVAIAASGAGLGFLIVAAACTAMMALMMGGMSHDQSDDRGGPGARG